MFELIGKLLLGLGLMFTGVQMLSLGVKQLGSRRFRKVATQFVSSRPRALVFGLGSGMIMQSTSAALMILASLITAGLFNVSQAIAVLTTFSVGNTLILFIVSLPIKEVVTFILGICGIGMYFSKNEKLRNVFLIGMGLGLIFFGVQIMVDGVKPLQNEAWFADFMAFSSQYSLLSIVSGVVLGFIAQSSTAVALVAIGLAKADVLTPSQTFLIMYGAAIGSTMFKVMLGKAFQGSSRQLVRFVNLFNVFGAGLFILLYYVEVWFEVPLLMAMVQHITHDLYQQATLMFLLFNLTSAIFFIIINKPLTTWLARTIPASEAEILSVPKYLSDFKPEDPDTGLELINLEQMRELEQIVAMFSAVRVDYEGPDIGIRHRSFVTLAQEVRESTANVASMTMSALTAKDHAYYHSRQALLEHLAESTIQVVKAIDAARNCQAIKQLSNSCLESIDFLLIFAVETLQSPSGENYALFRTLSSNNGPSIEKLRKTYIDNDALTSAKDKGILMELTIATERIIWLLNRMMNLVPS